MPRGFLLVLCSTVAFSQVPPREPFDIAVQSYWDARAGGNFEQAAARREEARRLLAQTPSDLPQFLGRVSTIAQIYQNSGRHAQSREVLQDALSRASSLGESHAIRIQLLNILANSWQQDGNLLKALSYREKAIAAQESAPPGATPDASHPGKYYANGIVGSIPGGGRVAVSAAVRSYPLPGRNANNSYMYQQLADLYRQLGRPEAVAKVVAKMRSLAQDDPSGLAAFYEGQGDLDEVIALYKKQAEHAAANPQAQLWEVIGPLQSIVMLYQREQRWEDAAATIELAVNRLESSGWPEARNRAVGMRLNLADLLQRAGQSQAAEQVYRTLLAQTANDRNGMQLQVVQAYANHLCDTNRAGQAEDLLKNNLVNRADLQPWQESNILFSLSEIARKAGRQGPADEYQRAGMEKQRTAQPQQPAEGQLIGPDLQKANAAVSQSNLDEGFNLALRAVASASFARDGDQVAWQIPSIAAALADRKAPEKGEQLYHELLSLAQMWSVDNATPLIQALQQYACFLIGQKDRWAEAPAVIERYREALVAAQGGETGELEQVMHLRIEFARARGAQADAVQSAEELLALEESLSGTTSGPYLRAAQTAANLYQSGGNLERALALHRQIVAIADLTLPANEAQRGSVRMNAAFAFANARRFDEAERLANEAVSVGERLRPPQTNLFARQLDQIRRMQVAAESGPVRTDGVGNAAVVTRDGRWFDVSALPTATPDAKAEAPQPTAKATDKKGSRQ